MTTGKSMTTHFTQTKAQPEKNDVPKDSMPDESPEKGTAVLAHSDASNPQPPQVPEYDLVRYINHGAFGEVWLARNVLDTYRAIKVVYRKTFQDSSAFEREFNGITKFEKVSGTHPGLLNVLQVGPKDAA